MQIKKLFKYLPITVIAAGLTVAASTPLLSLLNNSDFQKNQIFNVDQAVDETEYTDQLDYIRNDVAKQTGVTNSVASIKLSDNSSSLGNSSAAIVTKTDGSTLLYMWGQNDFGQLGNGTSGSSINTSTPTPVDSTPFDGKKITQISLGQFHSAALLDDGSLYMWGNNENGQLGNGTETSTSTPTPVDSTPFGSKKIIQIALGQYHSAALLADGSLYTWGNNIYGQLGNGTTSKTSAPAPVNSTPFGSIKITEIALGESHSAALLDDGNLFMWGLNNSGQLGITDNSGTTTANPNPKKVTVPSGRKITKIALGRGHSAAILEDGNLYMWGLNNYGQLGDGTTSKASTPIPVTALSGKKITEISLSTLHSAALLEDGSLFMWGYNYYGQLGNTINNASSNSNPTPAAVTALNGQKIKQIAIGGYHSTALLEDGSLYMWGYNSSGQLGFTANTAPNPSPTWMSQLGKDSHITAKSAITAKNAVDNLWVDNKFNLVGFKNSFNLINIPDATDQTYEIEAKPTYNNVAGTVTMNIKIKYFYNENGLIVANTAATPMIISGFKEVPIRTNITVKTPITNLLVVDKWLSYVTVDGKINRTKLEEFLTLTEVPNDAIFTITESDQVNKTGVLTFKINTNKAIDDSSSTIDTPSDFAPFPITLNLTPRITKMTAITTGYPSNILAADLKAELFNEDGLVIDLNVLSKYLIVVVPVDGATYHLVADTWEPSDDGKEVKFSIWVDKYYDLDGNEQTGTATTIANRIDFDLQLTGAVIVPADDQFPWWWIIVGTGGAGLIAVGAWYGIKKYKATDVPKNSTV